MKKILITGVNSYIGTSLENWLKKIPDKYIIDTIDMRGDLWKKKNFSMYDVVFHVAGIAHVSLDSNMENLYNKVNTKLAIETAKKAKDEGVKQFIFMSSIIIYGNSRDNKSVIDRSTIPNPSNFYGKSKLKAEQGIKQLDSEGFKIVILRPPMIYGRNSRGNYPKLARAAKKIPIFPNIENKRSMLYIDNLCEFIRIMIDNNERGLFFPQNSEYVKTSEMVKLIAEAHGKKIRLVKIFNPILKAMQYKVELINKVFGNLVYEKSISEYKDNYRVKDLRESILASEK